MMAIRWIRFQTSFGLTTYIELKAGEGNVSRVYFLWMSWVGASNRIALIAISYVKLELVDNLHL